MIRRPPRSTRTDTLFPYTTLFRSAIDVVKLGLLVGAAPLRLQRPDRGAEHGNRQTADADSQRASVQARDRARLGAQHQRLGRDLARLQRGEVGGVVLADRKSVVTGKRVSVGVDTGGRRHLTKST